MEDWPQSGVSPIVRTADRKSAPSAQAIDRKEKAAKTKELKAQAKAKAKAQVTQMKDLHELIRPCNHVLAPQISHEILARSLSLSLESH